MRALVFPPLESGHAMSIALPLHEAAAAMNGRWQGETAAHFVGVSTDSRSILAGELFVALRGVRFDGHAFLAAVQARGAAAAVVDAVGSVAAQALNFPHIVVADTGLALGALAANWRARFQLPIIAVTGSNGKTTSKEMIACIARAALGDQAVLATQGNLNNEIGLPLTLLKLTAEHRFAVVEMGMSHPGEIAYLAQTARPNVALITNAQRAHLAGMGQLADIAREKGTIFSGLTENGVAVFSADAAAADAWRKQSQGHLLRTFSLGHAADVQGCVKNNGLENRLTIETGGEKIELPLALPGEHNARNALGAATAALAAGLSLSAVRDGLQAFRGVKGRLQRGAGMRGSLLLDDSYNANPDSVRAAIDVLAAMSGCKILVLGDMGEIGGSGAALHEEVGDYARQQGVDRLFALGELSAQSVARFGSGGQHFQQIEALIRATKAELSAETVVLIKGSRFMAMERVVAALAETEPANADIKRNAAPCC